MTKEKIKKRNTEGYYTVGDKKYLSVTTYMSEVFGLPINMVRFFHAKYGWDESQRLLNIASSYGSQVHKALHDYFFNDTPADDIIKDRVIEINKQLVHHEVIPIDGEQVVYSHKLKTAGTLDFYGTYKGSKICVLDWKTGSTNSTKELLQLSAYGYMLVENQKNYKLPFPITTKDIVGIVVHVGKDDTKKPKVTVFDNKDIKKGINGFKSLIKLYNLKRRFR